MPSPPAPGPCEKRIKRFYWPFLGENCNSSAGPSAPAGSGRPEVSELNADGDLHTPRRARGVRSVERGVDHLSGRVELGIGVQAAELRVVERVVGLQAQLAGDALLDPK